MDFTLERQSDIEHSLNPGSSCKKKRTHSYGVCSLFLKATTRFELVMTVLQTGALPLG